MAALAGVPARHAVFHEEKTLAALTTPLRSLGHLAYRRPDHLEKITDGPVPESLVVDGSRLTLTPAGAAAQTVDLQSQPEIAALVDTVRGVLAGDRAVLERHYTLRLEGSLPLWRLTLVPAEPALARFVRSVQVDGSGAEPRVIETVQTNGDTDRLMIDPAS